jgi:hypothetical protein
MTSFAWYPRNLFAFEGALPAPLERLDDMIRVSHCLVFPHRLDHRGCFTVIVEESFQRLKLPIYLHLTQIKFGRSPPPWFFNPLRHGVSVVFPPSVQVERSLFQVSDLRDHSEIE